VGRRGGRQERRAEPVEDGRLAREESGSSGEERRLAREEGGSGGQEGRLAREERGGGGGKKVCERGRKWWTGEKVGERRG